MNSNIAITRFTFLTICFGLLSCTSSSQIFYCDNEITETLGNGTTRTTSYCPFFYNPVKDKIDSIIISLDAFDIDTLKLVYDLEANGEIGIVKCYSSENKLHYEMNTLKGYPHGKFNFYAHQQMDSTITYTGELRNSKLDGILFIRSAKDQDIIRATYYKKGKVIYSIERPFSN